MEYSQASRFLGYSNGDGVDIADTCPLEAEMARALYGRPAGLVNWDGEMKLESNANCKLYLITY